MNTSIDMQHRMKPTEAFPYPTLILGREPELDAGEKQQRQRDLQDRWDQYAEQLFGFAADSALSEITQAAFNAHKNSGLTTSEEEGRKILGSEKTDLDTAKAAQAALMHVYSKWDCNHVSSAREALVAFTNVLTAFKGGSTAFEASDTEYPDFRIQRITQCAFPGTSRYLKKQTRVGAAKFWIEVLKQAKSQWDFSSFLEKARERCNMMSDIDVVVPASVTRDLLGVGGLTDESASAIQSVLLALYNEDRSGTVPLGTLVQGLMIFIHNHPKLRDDNLDFDKKNRQRKPYVVTYLARQ